MTRHDRPEGVDVRGTQPLPVGFVSFLFSDIEGSTRLFRSLGDAYVDVLERHHELLRAVWDSHHGVEVKTEGDAFFVAFAKPEDAIAAAAAAQQAIAAEPWSTDEPLRVRMGIHSGLAAPRDRDYIAYAVHQAARVVGAAHGGQVLVTEDTVRAAGDPGVELRPLGRFRLRDFDEPVALYRAVAAGVADDPRMPRATPAMGHNLTEPATSFVGRTRDLAELTELVTAGGLLSIVGPGGAGKTRLAIELGMRLADDWPDGVWLVELAPLPAGAPLGGVTAEAMRVATGTRDPLEAIVADFASKSAVVILDNCEHVAESAAQLAGRLLRELPSFAVIATSREPLGLGQERAWRIQPLSADDEAVELFIERASRGTQGSPHTEDQLAAIRRICTRLDGNALAIELAAARVDTVGLAGLEAALDDRFRVLRTRRRDLDPRQQSMTALLDWSYDLLDPGEQAVFRRLAAFNDHFTLDGAEVAAVDDTVDVGTAIDAVWALVDKSLLVVDGSASETRYAMSETVHDYAEQQWHAANEKEAVWRRLGDWYLERFGPWTAFGTGELSALRVDLDNVRGVVDGLAEHDVETAQGLAVSVAYLRDVSGQFREGVAEVEAWVRRLTAASPMRAVLLTRAARLRSRLGDTDSRDLLDEAEELVRTAGPEPTWATGTVAMMRAEWLSATGDTAGALAIAQDIVAGDPPLVALARGYSAIGWLRGAAGDAEGALEAYLQGLAVEEQLGGPIEIAVGHNNVAEYAVRLGRVAEASRHQAEVLELAAQAGSVVLVAFSLVIAARVAASRQEWERAVRLHGAAERWLEESGYSLEGEDAAASEAVLAEGKVRLGDAYESTWRAGGELSLADAIVAARDALRDGAR